MKKDSRKGCLFSLKTLLEIHIAKCRHKLGASSNHAALDNKDERVVKAVGLGCNAKSHVAAKPYPRVQTVCRWGPKLMLRFAGDLHSAYRTAIA